MTDLGSGHPIVSGIRRYPGRSAALIVLTAAAAAAVSWRIAEDNSSGDRQGQWVQVQPRVVEQQLGLVGRIQAAHQETLAAPFDALIREVLVREGQSVAAGQALLRLDTTQLDIQQRQALAELLKAQRDAHQLRNWANSAEVARARRIVQAARAALTNTQANWRDTQALFERGIVARLELEALTQQLHAQQQDLLAAQDELRTVEARGQGEERRIAEMELSNAQARHRAVSLQSEQQVLRAPFSGVVIRPSVPEGGKPIITQPGVQISQGTPLLTVIALDRLQVLTRVQEADLHRLSENLPVRITGDGFPDHTLTGRISAIAIQGQAADTLAAAAHYDLVVAVDTPKIEAAQGIRLGMSAQLAIVLYRNEQAIVVPAQALTTESDGSLSVLYRATPESMPSKRPVVPIQAFTQGIEVQGLPSGYILAP